MKRSKVRNQRGKRSNPLKHKLGNLIGGFIAIAIGAAGIQVAMKSLKESGVLEDKNTLPNKTVPDNT